jgi:hypothetical protein
VDIFSGNWEVALKRLKHASISTARYTIALAGYACGTMRPLETMIASPTFVICRRGNGNHEPQKKMNRKNKI